MGLLTVAANPMRELGAVLFTDNQYTQAVPFTITGGTPVQIPNNKNGFINLSAPDSMVNIIDNTGRFTPLNGNNDSYGIRINCQCDPNTNNRALFLEVDIGSGTPVIIYGTTTRLAANRNTVSPISFWIPAFCGALFLANGGSFKIDTDDSSADIYNISHYIERKFLGHVQ